MRITNGIINNNTKNNILVNKEYNDRYNTMMATGQKITRPSDDPIVAIRALRLNNNINEINQYYDKNIPDALAWMESTETALTQTQSVLESVQSNLTQGASDDNTAEDRKNILENLKGLRDQIYASGNSDYAGRTVFTGYRTSETLTYMKDETQLFTIVQNFTNADLEDIKYVKGDRDYDLADPASVPADYDQTKVSYEDISRIRLAYDKLTDAQVDTEGQDLGYKLHLWYGCKASPSERSYATINDSPEALTFSWEVTTTPVSLEGKKPLSCITIDSTKVDPDKLKDFEEILYGKEGIDPELPMPEDVIDFFSAAP